MMTHEAQDRLDHAPWPLRAVILAALGAMVGLLLHRLTNGTDSAIKGSLAALVVVFGITLAFSLERLRWHWSLAFAAGSALVAALVAWWNGNPGGWGADEGWHFASALAAVAIAVPLFQGARDEGELRLRAPPVHAHAWTNLILAAAAVAFTGTAMLLTILLSELFGLIGVDFLRDLLRKGWFAIALACAAFGGAVGLLRDRDVVTSNLQRVGRTVLSVLAPVLAAGLVFFVLALPFTGLSALWEQTRATTPIVLACMLGALVLTNAVAGNSADEEAKAPLLRWSAMALAVTMVPLAAVAALSTGQRITQHGFTPDRLWAAVFVAVAAAVALGYAWALFRGRSGWPAPLREINVRLAGGICLLGLFLALPVVSFGSLSARDQVGRLVSGKVTPERFDWAALRFDFGPAGRRTLERLAASGRFKANATAALKGDSRWAIQEAQQPPPAAPKLDGVGSATISPGLMETIAQTRRCSSDRDRCRLAFVNPGEAVLINAVCDTCSTAATVFRLENGVWTQRNGTDQNFAAATGQPTPAAGTGKIEIRTVKKRQVFVDGKPVGLIFD